MPRPLPTLQEMARLLGGEIEVDNGSVSCPGPGHNPTDRSLTVKPDASNPEGFVVKPFSPRDDWRECRDMVRSKLGLPKWEPKKKTKKQNGNGGGKPYSPTIAKYIYRTAEGEPYLCVHRLADKKAGFPQYHWDGEKWKSGKPKGEKIPYRLPELIAAPITTPVYVVEGEGKADLLAKLGFTVTSASEGAGKWTADLNEWFKDRVVYILLDNDKPGHDHGQLVARNLDPVAKSVRVVALPGLPHKGDIKQWLEHDPAGARLVKECERAPLWGPAAEKPRTTEADEALVAELAALSTLAYAKRRKEAADEIGIAVSLLDKAVAEARGEREVSSPVLYPHWNVDPSDEPVEIAALLRSLIEVLRRYVVMTEEQTLVVALWIVFTWLHEQVAVHSPILLVTAPTDTCGKTTLLHVVGFLVRNGMSSRTSTVPLHREMGPYLCVGRGRHRLQKRRPQGRFQLRLDSWGCHHPMRSRDSRAAPVQHVLPKGHRHDRAQAAAPHAYPVPDSCDAAQAARPACRRLRTH